MEAARIRNFAIIAHIDHGKSTLADRLLELTGSLAMREMQEQVLDSMDLERERGITIKAHAVRMLYPAQDGQIYQLNLIDTPGHVDFSYEVSRSLAACEGALLVVDASQGVEAQTLANSYLAINHGLEIIPVINKIDLQSADVERTKEMIESAVGLDASDALLISAKTGPGCARCSGGDREARSAAERSAGTASAGAALRFVVRSLSRRGGAGARLRRTLRKGQKIRLWSNGHVFQVETLGVLTPKPVEIDELVAGEVGFIIANIKNVADTKIGDTITDDDRPSLQALPGFEEIKPMVFAGLYTVDAHEHTQLREALEKLKLNDSSFFFEPESSVALGFGFRCGFLGLLHMEIIQERLEREYNLDLITTAPGVRYQITKTDGEVIEVDNPSRWPDVSEIAKVEEPVILAVILTNEEYVGGILKLVEEKRGKQKSFEYVSSSRVMLQYELPLNEIVLDFYDRLKSVSRGYASLDYHLSGNWVSPMAKLDIMVAGEPVDALSTIIHRDFAYDRGRALAAKMKQLIPRQMFEVAIQAAIGAKIIARETVPAIRKNVIAKCYGGDITRKRKLLEKQKEGKKRMKRIGRVDIPQEAFLAVLKVGEDSG
jgi:GTP-binding protein LepA